MTTEVDKIAAEVAGRVRAIIENVSPTVDNGRFPVKRIVGDVVEVSADIIADGHDQLAAVVLLRAPHNAGWLEIPLAPLVNDRWVASFVVDQPGTYSFKIAAWIDPYRSWASKLEKRMAAAQDTTTELGIGAGLLDEASGRAHNPDAALLRSLAKALRLEGQTRDQAEELALSDDTVALVAGHADRAHATASEITYTVTVDRERAAFSSWYEMFPRSCSAVQGSHGTFKDCEARLAYVASLGFDVLYLPPIHPIGTVARKGRNNSVKCQLGDPGTPWAIGSAEGGHKSISPLLGTVDDFRAFVRRAEELGIEVALDIALQCAPDHPYVKEHPDWFRWRPDGTIQYAENPPKKYQDIYPMEFDSDDWPAMWLEFRSVFEFWIAEGIRIFRVDNPHTKPFAFWEWLIGSLRKRHPDLIFLSEAFTRPKVMYRLAKLGFTQSYTYFTWRRTKWELTEYLTELTMTGVGEFFRPNFWPNTPDILMDYLQEGGRPAFQARLVLAATLSSNFGIYGPAFELCVNTPREKGSEEYLNSEKYEIKHWDFESPESIRDVVSRVNAIRTAHPALQRTNNLTFHQIDNDQLIAYSKLDERTHDLVLTIVNIDPRHTQSGWVHIDFRSLGVGRDSPFRVRDLLRGDTYTWHGESNYVELNPDEMPAHIFEVMVPAAETSLADNAS
ncbi:alpha-1,4-glucan--maltose-1-phosphate maltosyltransferase [Chloroflexota bacterium]